MVRGRLFERVPELRSDPFVIIYSRGDYGRFSRLHTRREVSQTVTPPPGVKYMTTDTSVRSDFTVAVN